MAWVGEMLAAAELVVEFDGLLGLWLASEIELGEDEEQEEGEGVRNELGWLL